MGTVINARARFARYVVMRPPPWCPDETVHRDAYGPVDVPVAPPYYPDELSVDRLLRNGRQVGYRTCSGAEVFFPGYEVQPRGRRAVQKPLAPLPRTALHSSGTDSPQMPKDVLADLEFLRLYGPR